ncbi:MAG: stalk domain-containing protein [Defluviitaleaceae bacterium]|nr:stalk domain-containing protein [Defluviitaleaceae bacterium]
MFKERAKGFVVGVLVTTLLSSTVVFASGVMREIHYGVNVVVNGRQLHLDGADRAFIMDGRTFVPASIIAQELGVPTNWVGATSTVYIGSGQASAAAPSSAPPWMNQAAPVTPQIPAPISIPAVSASFAQAVPPYDVSRRHSTDHRNNADVRRRDQITMGGIVREEVITYRVQSIIDTVHSLHNLGGQFNTVSGYIGRVDGWGEHNGTFNFFGDGRLIQSFELRATDLPRPISVNVAGVSQLRIEFTVPHLRAGNTTMYAFVGTIQ